MDNRNSELPPESDSADDLTLEEMLSLLTGANNWSTAAVERVGIEPVRMADGPHGLRVECVGPDGKTGSHPATAFPTAAVLAATWNRDLARRVGEALGDEAASLGVDILLGPGTNIKRTPVCGRNFEYFSEDPLLAGELAAAYIIGVQSRGVGASLKHFAANNQEFDRSHVSSDVDERTLREIYLKPFEIAVRKAKPWTLMCAYNKLNGSWCSQNDWLLDRVLRRDWGYDGVVISDWGAVHDQAAAVAAGTDLEMPGRRESSADLARDIEKGRLDPAAVARNAARLVGLARKAERARPGRVRDFDRADHHALAREVAVEGIVLLKNDGAFLPLRPRGALKLAVIGEFGRTPIIQGGGSSGVHADRVDSPLEELRALAPAGMEIDFAHAYLNWHTVPAMDQVGDALALARRSDRVVLFVGNTDKMEAEGFDRTSLMLHPHQEKLISELVRANPRTVVVLQSGSAIDVGAWADSVPAIIWQGFAGGGGGQALARILLGLANPCGKLAETFPRRLEDCSTHGSYPGNGLVSWYAEGLFVGYRHYDSRGLDVAFPFGHGLSYTDFGYSDLKADIVPGGNLEISLCLRNEGDRDGSETVQVYVSRPESRHLRPAQELKEFVSVRLAAGERRQIKMLIARNSLAHWDRNTAAWAVEAGQLLLRVGSSSRDIRLERSVNLD